MGSEFRSLYMASVLLTASCDGEFGERLEGVAVLRMPCSDLDEGGYPVESRFPLGVYCNDGVCTGDQGTMQGETQWNSNHCSSTQPDGSGG